MDGSEILVLLLSCFLTYKFYKNWYSPVFKVWHPQVRLFPRLLMGALPFISFIILFYTLSALASFDVVTSPLYIFFYLIMGYGWIYIGLTLMSFFFDIVWSEDVLKLNNEAALYPVAGGFLGLTLIFAGANIGDGPGWWCVIFAGGLGLTAWYAFASLINRFTQIFERITIERNIPCGIRFGFYLLSSGIILGRASAGDWTSFLTTIIELGTGWPVLILTLLALTVEYYFSNSLKRTGRSGNMRPGGLIAVSILCGMVFIAIAVAGVLLQPLYEIPVPILD